MQLRVCLFDDLFASVTDQRSCSTSQNSEVNSHGGRQRCKELSHVGTYIIGMYAYTTPLSLLFVPDLAHASLQGPQPESAEYRQSTPYSVQHLQKLPYKSPLRGQDKDKGDSLRSPYCVWSEKAQGTRQEGQRTSQDSRH